MSNKLQVGQKVWLRNTKLTKEPKEMTISSVGRLYFQLAGDNVRFVKETLRRDYDWGSPERVYLSIQEIEDEQEFNRLCQSLHSEFNGYQRKKHTLEQLRLIDKIINGDQCTINILTHAQEMYDLLPRVNDELLYLNASIQPVRDPSYELYTQIGDLLKKNQPMSYEEKDVYQFWYRSDSTPTPSPYPPVRAPFPPEFEKFVASIGEPDRKDRIINELYQYFYPVPHQEPMPAGPAPENLVWHNPITPETAREGKFLVSGKEKCEILSSNGKVLVYLVPDGTASRNLTIKEIQRMFDHVTD